MNMIWYFISWLEVVNNLQRIKLLDTSDMLPHFWGLDVPMWTNSCRSFCWCVAKQCLNSNQPLLTNSAVKAALKGAQWSLIEETLFLLLCCPILTNSCSVTFKNLWLLVVLTNAAVKPGKVCNSERRTFVSNRGGSAGSLDPRCWVQLKSYFLPSFPRWKLNVFWRTLICPNVQKPKM